MAFAVAVTSPAGARQQRSILVVAWSRVQRVLRKFFARQNFRYAAISAAFLWVMAKALRYRINANWGKGLDRTRSSPDTSLLDSVENESDVGDSSDDERNVAEAVKSRDKEDAPSEGSRSMLSFSHLAANGYLAEDKRVVLAQCGVFASLDEEILCFLVERASVIDFASGDVVFERGKARDAFLVVHSGELRVTIEPKESQSSDGALQSTYALGPSSVAVGLLFVLAGIDVSGPQKSTEAARVASSLDCRFHCSTAHAGKDGAVVIALPTSALEEAFDAFPIAMKSLARLLCARLTLVVWETLSDYFGLHKQILVRENAPSIVGISDPQVLSSMKPPDIFARALNCDEPLSGGLAATLASAELLDRQIGEFAMPLNQRAPYILILLEGELDAEFMASAGVGMECVGNSLPLNNPQYVPNPSSPTLGTPTGYDIRKARRVTPGAMIGELSVFIDRPLPLAYRCITDCRFAMLPRESVERLLELEPRKCCLGLLRVVADKAAEWLHRVDAALDWVYIKGGRRLFQKGDPMRGFYVVLSGRLLTLEEHDPSSPSRPRWRIVDSLQRGRLCGAFDCLQQFAEYTGTVRAGRDTEVCRISPSLLQLLAIDFPGAILHFASKIAQTSRLPSLEIGKVQQVPVTIAVVPADESVNVHDVCTRLTSSLRQMGKCVHVSPDSDLVGDREFARSLDGPRLARLLAALEERCRWLVYEAEPALTRWTRRCLRQADLVLIAIRFDGASRGDVPPSAIEYYVEEVARQGGMKVERQLLLLHDSPNDARDSKRSTLGKPMVSQQFLRTNSSSALLGMNVATGPACASEDTLRPGFRGVLVDRFGKNLFGIGPRNGTLRSTRHYLFPRPWARRWYHVRVGEAGDWGRCARLLVGEGIGLCLGGGGARGNLHFGVIKAMNELGIPIDCVSGCSFGALVGGMYSMTAADPGSLQRVIERVMGNMFSTRGMLMDINFPRTAMFTGRYLNKVLQQVFARRRCEDLLIPFACTTTDILNFEAKAHKEGPLWRIVRASMSLVGFVPPLPHHETRPGDGQICNSLLVDGGYTNQYPTDELKQLGAGTVLCVQACPEYEPISTAYGDRVLGGAVALLRFLRIKWRWYEGPDPPPQAEIQERLMYLPDWLKGDPSTGADLFIKPSTVGFGLLEFARFRELEDLGYKHALPHLDSWLAGDSEAATKLRHLIQRGKYAELPGVGSHEAMMVATEYGGRLGYSRWRQSMKKSESAPANNLNT